MPSGKFTQTIRSYIVTSTSLMCVFYSLIVSDAYKSRHVTSYSTRYNRVIYLVHYQRIQRKTNHRQLLWTHKRFITNSYYVPFNATNERIRQRLALSYTDKVAYLIAPNEYINIHVSWLLDPFQWNCISIHLPERCTVSDGF